MYRKSSVGWAKHFDFMLWDFICLQIAYISAYCIRHSGSSPFQNQLYRNMILVFFSCQMFVGLFDESYKNILKRGYVQEFASTFRHVLLTILLSTLYLFMTHTAGMYSRTVMIITAEIYFFASYIVRCLWKDHLKRRGASENGRRSLVVLTTEEMAGDVIEELRENDYSGLRLVGIALMEEGGNSKIGKKIAGVPVVADADTVVEYVCREWVDEVLFSLPREVALSEKMYNELVEMGVTVHLRILRAMRMEGQKQSLGKIGNYTVLSNSINMVTMRQAFCKRVLDILGGTVGCLITAVLCIFVGPAIYIQSPGPIFFSQERVGKNGKKFRLYKFRSMYMDAEARKKDLMEQNRIKDGLMFKMENDPRIIGGEKGVGGIIRRFSIDEFPQFWNVLKGDMSLVGTRPPTVEEWEKYDLHHRVRLAIKPGITGMWQVSGRSKITDFDEVVRLDKEYIMSWNMGLDIRILFRTVSAVLQKDGAF